MSKNITKDEVDCDNPEAGQFIAIDDLRRKDIKLSSQNINNS
jgi:hypothetical protein